MVRVPGHDEFLMSEKTQKGTRETVPGKLTDFFGGEECYFLNNGKGGPSELQK
jgi:hypothetical protein